MKVKLHEVQMPVAQWLGNYRLFSKLLSVDFSINGVALPNCSSVSDLGVIFGRELKFSKHVDFSTKRPIVHYL